MLPIPNGDDVHAVAEARPQEQPPPVRAAAPVRSRSGADPRDPVIVTAVRTPVGKAVRGSLRHVRPEDLGALVLREAVSRTPGLAPEDVDDVLIGCAMPEGEQGLNLGRIVVLRAGFPAAVPALTVNRFCASGLQAIAMAAERIRCGAADVVVAGGAESMSCVPMSGYRPLPNPYLVEHYPEVYMAMGHTAEEVARRYGVTRERQDAFALESHRKAAAAWAAGRFRAELVPVEIAGQELAGLAGPPGAEGHGGTGAGAGRRPGPTGPESAGPGPTDAAGAGPLGRAASPGPSVPRARAGTAAEVRSAVFDTDECVRRDTTPEALAKLKPAFLAAGGTVTAGNASPMSDGAAAVVVLSRARAEALGLRPLAVFRAFAVAGVEPEIMGVGPVLAIPKALRLAGIDRDDVDLFELNEAFAAQALHVIDKLELDPGKVNVNGGAIALGHPLGCTGAKLSVTLMHEARRRGDCRYGVVSMCVGGGMGAAGVFEFEPGDGAT